MIARRFGFEKQGSFSRFEAEIESESAIRPQQVVRFDFGADIPAPKAPGDPWLAALLIPAMFAGEPLEIRAPVSRRLVRTAAEFQRLFHSWYPDLLNEVAIKTPEVVATQQHDETGRTAAFFSGGVDSWYSLVKHPEVSALITVKGFDIPAADEKIWPEVTRANRIVAEESHAELITVTTNIRDLVDPGLGCFRRRYQGSDFWGACYHGVCLDAVGLFLQERFSYVVVPASWQYARLQPWGSHPFIDTLWGNGRLEFIHDGAEASRMDKLRALARLPRALRHLRVCPDFTRGAYNCGECEKCRRTLLALRVLGADDPALPFNKRLDLRAFELNPPKPYVWPLYQEILDEAQARGNREMVHYLRALTGQCWSPRYHWHRWKSRMRRSLEKRLRRRACMDASAPAAPTR